MTVSFRSGETTGSVADRRIETAKQETTGGVGVKAQQSIFSTDNELKRDTVSFKGNEAERNKQKTSAFGTVMGLTALAAAIVVGLGCAHKYDVVGKIKNEKVQKFFRHTDVVSEPCHKACTWIKQNCYDKLVNLFKK